MIRRRGLRRLLKQRVVVHTKDDRSIRGVLDDEFADSALIAAPVYLNEAQSVPVPGQVLVLLSNVSSVQVLPAEEA